MRKHANGKTWKKSHRQNKRRKSFAWVIKFESKKSNKKFCHIKLNEESEKVLRDYCAKNNLSLAKGFIKTMELFVKGHKGE